MQLTDINYFIELAYEKNVTKVAEKLHVSQPTITMSLHRLEEEFGKELMIRGRGKKLMELTKSGQQLLVHAERIKREVQLIRIELDQQFDQTIRFGLPPIIGSYFAPHFLRTLTREELATIEIIATGSKKMQQWLLENKVDMALVATEYASFSEHLHREFLSKDEFYICTSLDHPLANQNEISFSELRNEQFISLDENHIHHRVLMNYCEENHFPEATKRFTMTTEIETAKNLIAANLGVGLMLQTAVQDRHDLHLIRLQKPVYFRIYLLYKEDHPLSASEWQLKEKIIQALRRS